MVCRLKLWPGVIFFLFKKQKNLHFVLKNEKYGKVIEAPNRISILA